MTPSKAARGEADCVEIRRDQNAKLKILSRETGIPLCVLIMKLVTRRKERKK